MTRQRALIAQILQQQHRHLTADEIYTLARETMPSLARGTVYRNLRLMEQAGEVVRLELPAGPDRYDATTLPHAHLYCDGCGTLRDLPVTGLQRQLEEGLGTPVRSFQLTVHYLCPNCR